ncbi:WecB/TagA/CpsF family glycosyltransferase [Terriglobus saanensis]|uniref:Glycosyl transferase, WecB/TagA/CpsF family n=1 Tax=Terriglobus saanensis (strain ATCC BAA-1853 / DSM 23119 / SP1PR4) TaxID=401053 RepID=E8V135_TERSS|nr:WecB/TagA/CpsF family glycosyltransferase [Terriglobus saanensis]ADV83383.1 glycosyl transferase, WecB/TagA/CpsF family [Terriglobus saanensis SP1PR4]
MTKHSGSPTEVNDSAISSCYCGEESTTSTSAFSHEHADVLGVKVSAINMSSGVDLADRWISEGHPGYICVTGVHGVMEAQKDAEFCEILNHAAINTPDGMPMSWVGHLQGFADMDRVFGPDFMSAMCQLSLDRGYRHFLYGGQPGVAEELKEVLETRFPGLQIVGNFTPPFRSLNTDEEGALMAQLRDSKPHILWVGLSTPKQERFMAQYVGRLQVPLLVGVGAAFDYHTGRVRDCAPWIKRAGLQWLHRLMQDPKRLWRRYLSNNPAFVWNITLQMLKLRRYPRTPTAPAPMSSQTKK